MSDVPSSPAILHFADRGCVAETSRKVLASSRVRGYLHAPSASDLLRLVSTTQSRSVRLNESSPAFLARYGAGNLGTHNPVGALQSVEKEFLRLAAISTDGTHYIAGEAPHHRIFTPGLR